MPEWVVSRRRDQELAAVRKSIQKSLLGGKLALLNKVPDIQRASRCASPIFSKDQLFLFREQNLDASGDIFFKPSRFQRSRKYHAELRGAIIVVFRNKNVALFTTGDTEAVVTVINVQHYDIDVVQKDDGCPRIYITSPACDEDALMYVKVAGGMGELDVWRHALARAKVALLPNLSDLTIESVIGRGGGGKVFMVQSKEENLNRAYALKVIDKTQAFKSSKAFRHVISERYLMEEAGKHPFLLQMQFAFQTERNLFIGTPFCEGGDLASYIRNKGKPAIPHTGIDIYGLSSLERRKRRVCGRLAETQTRQVAAEVLLGLEHLHRRGIIYRDLKPENIFIDGSGHIKIGDYGLAKRLNEVSIGPGRLRTASICGTRNYIPPEMLFGRMYSFEADLWCLGVMLYRMLCGTFPFDAARTKDVFHKVKGCEPRLPAWLSVEAKGLLVGLLQKDVGKRLTVDGVKAHDFFRGVDWDDVLHRRSGPCIPDVETGSCPMDALENFELSKLQGVTLGEYVGEIREETPPGHVVKLENVVIGFEYGCVRDDEGDPAPLAITQKSGGIFSKLASIDYDQFPLSPRKSYGRGGS